MSQDMQAVLRLVAAGAPLDEEQAEVAFGLLMQGEAMPSQVGALLMGLHVRGETAAEIIGASRAMTARMAVVDAPGDAIDVCGTGGDTRGTRNVSTAVAFVVAGCGVPVAKHGNRALSSRSGAADVLEALGVGLELSCDDAGRAIVETGIGFLFAPGHHPAMRHVAQVRQELGVRTIFNLLGPLCNPARVRHQLLGVFAAHWLVPFAEVLRASGCRRAWVVYGHDGLDELTTTTASSVAELRAGVVTRFEVTPEQAGLARATLDDLRGGDARDNAAALRALLLGQAGPYRDIVVLNAAAALVVAGRADDLMAGAALARQSIDSGAAGARLDALVRVTNPVPA